MLPSPPGLQRPRRGAALLELAVVVPVLVSLLLFSLFLLDIVRARIKVREASRYVAWEMTRYALSDHGQGRHERAFDGARQAVVAEATERFADLDSLEPSGRFGFMLRAEPATVTIQNQTVDGFELTRVFPGGAGGLGPEAAAAAGQPLGFFLDRFHFNTRGQVSVEVGTTLASTLLPQNFLQKESGGFFSVDHWGGRDLSRLPVRSRYTLIADGWHLPEGGDAVMRARRAGMPPGGAPHGLRAQVARMTFLGVGDYFAQVGLERFGAVAHFLLPDFRGPFVVAHNYVPSESGRGCNKDAHGAAMGLNNLNTHPGLDDPAQRCFDTAPFRDTQTYDRSLYRKMFMARGPHFMGCKNAQADTPHLPGLDPSTSTDTSAGRVSCE